MNRHDRRAARRRGCWAGYTTLGRPAAHPPAACDGSCHAGEVALPVPPVPKAELTAARTRLAWAAREVMPPAQGDDAGWTLTVIGILAIGALADAALARARALAPLLARLREIDSAWAQLREVLEALGAPRSQHDHGPPASGGVVVRCCPRTGPPGAWPAPEAMRP